MPGKIILTSAPDDGSRREIRRPGEPSIKVIVKKFPTKFWVTNPGAALVEEFETKDVAEDFAQLVAEECESLPSPIAQLFGMDLDAYSGQVEISGWRSARAKWKQQQRGGENQSQSSPVDKGDSQ